MGATPTRFIRDLGRKGTFRLVIHGSVGDRRTSCAALPENEGGSCTRVLKRKYGVVPKTVMPCLAKPAMALMNFD